MRPRLLLTAFLLTITAYLSAQTLSGKITNSQNQPIAGASVQVTGTGHGTTTTVEGNYSITLQGDGKHEIEVSAVGYVSKIISDIEKVNGAYNELNITLETKSADLEGVVVTARRVTAAAANTSALLNFQKNNTAVSSVIAADFIRRTPDKNTGEVLKRVSGASIQDNKFVIIRGLSDRYNSAYLNGALLPSSEPDRKTFSFDVIPSQLVDNIVINKTATPELTGEFAGGIVQVNTKDVPTNDILSLGISLGYNTNSTFKDFRSNERNSKDWIGYDDGTRKLPAGIPANAAGFNSNNVEYTKLFNSNVYSEKVSKAIPIQTYNLTYGIGRKYDNGGSLGIVAGLTYRNAQQKYLVDRLIGEAQKETITRQFVDDQNRYGVNTGAVLNVTYLLKRTKISLKNLLNQNFEDNYYTRTGKDFDRGQDVNFRSSFLNQRTLYSAQLEAEQQLTQGGIKLKANGNFSYNWKIQPDLRTISYFRPAGTNDPFSISFDESSRFFSNLKDYTYGGTAQILVPFNLFNEKQNFKIGGGSIMRIRDFSSRNFRWFGRSASASQKALPFDQIFQPENISSSGFQLEEITQLEDKYFGVSAVTSGYAMFDNKLSNNIRLIWGVRAENFEQVLTAKRSDLKRIVVDKDQLDILPSLNLVYNITPNHIVRLSGSKTIARPEFREIAPFSFFDFEQNYAVSGDTTLNRTQIYNADLRYEWYPKAGESVSFGAFYKKFDNPIELRARNNNPRRYSFQNADEANILGFELEARKSLDFVSSSLENFSVFTNLTYITSKVNLKTLTSTGQSTSFNRPLQGQSSYLINLGLQYAGKDNDITGTLLYNRIGQRIILVGDVENLGLYDIYESPRDQLDFQITKKVLKRKGELRLNIADILNQKYLFYENFDSKKAYSNSADRVFYSYKSGSTISLGLTYNFLN